MRPIRSGHLVSWDGAFAPETEPVFEPGPASVSNYFDINNEYVATLLLLI